MDSRSESESSAKKPISLRDQQREVTRERILTALADLIQTKSPLEVTMSAVAEHAGVSEPTLYRHFSTKANLFAALGSNLYQKVTVGVAPSTVDELIDFLPGLYQQFASLEATVRWNLAAPREEVVRPPSEDRLPILQAAVSRELEELSETESEFLMRGLLLLTSPTCLLYWQDYLRIAVDEAAATAGWMIQQLSRR